MTTRRYTIKKGPQNTVDLVLYENEEAVKAALLAHISEHIRFVLEMRDGESQSNRLLTVLNQGRNQCFDTVYRRVQQELRS